MKASYAIVNACDELIVAEETEGSNKLLTMLVDSVALLGLFPKTSLKLSTGYLLKTDSMNP